MIEWKPIAEAPELEYVVLRGDSGYMGTPYRLIVARRDVDYRPRQPWVTYAGDSVTDDGEMPTHFATLKELGLE